MKRLFGGLMGSKASPSDALQDLVAQLSGNGVSKQTWEQVIAFENLEEELENSPRRDNLAACLARCPENFFGLLVLCTESIEGELAKKADDFDERAETSLANCFIVLSYLFAATPAAPARGAAEGSSDDKVKKEAANVSFLDRLWKADEQTGRPLGERIADAVMRALFKAGFAVDEVDTSEATELVDGVMPALIWSEGVGPEGSNQPSDNGLQSNRVVTLQLLIAFLSGGSASVGLEEEDKNGDPENEAAWQAEDAKLSRPLLLDVRPLAYLSNPDRTAPYRAELLYSLLSVALGYDPHGYGVPYGGYFAGAKQEAFAQLCIQALGLLLQDLPAAADATGALGIADFINVKRPQEMLNSTSGTPDDSCAKNEFRRLLLAITSEREVSFMVEGVVTLLGTVSKERSSYLPNSLRLPPFLSELLVLVFHLSRCPKFVEGACEEEEILNVVEGVLQAADKTPEHVSETAVGVVEAAILLNLTAYREVCIELDEEFEGDLPDELPDFQGSGADLIALRVLTQAAESLGKCKASKSHMNIAKMGLATFSNLAPFADGFCVEVTSRMFAIFERCSKPSQLKRGRAGLATFLPSLLEAFDSALQYKYSPNTNLAYGLMTRQALFEELASWAAGVPTEGAAKEDSDFVQGLQVHLTPIVGLLKVTVPMLEAEVEKQEISSSEEAKDLLPRSILGLMPAPHAFQSRSLRPCAPLQLSMEHVLVNSVGNGPLSPLWEIDEDVEDSGVRGRSSESRDTSVGQKSSKRERSSSRARDKDSSRTRGAAKSAPKSPPAKLAATPSAPTSPPAKSAQPAAPSTEKPNGASHAVTPEVLPAASSTAEEPSQAPAPAADPLRAQLEAAAAVAGVDVATLLQQLQAAPST